MGICENIVIFVSYTSLAAQVGEHYLDTAWACIFDVCEFQNQTPV